MAKKPPARAKARPTPTRPKPTRSVALVPRQPEPTITGETGQSLVLGDEASIGALGLAELRLTDQEEAVLSRPVDETQVLVKPTGEAYLSHPSYTRLFNEAFGRLGWSLRPVSKPTIKDALVVCPYVLYIHGHPVAYALGEQEYSPSNPRQSYGDAIESTVASALRRCAKRIGIGLELWDKRWLHRFEAAHILKVQVTVKKGGEEKTEYWFRRKDDPPFWQEQKAQRAAHGQRQTAPQAARPTAASAPARTSQHPHEDAPITDPQRRRLFTIASHHGRSEQDVKAYLLKTYKIGSTRDLQRKDYDAVISAIEASGPLGGPTPPLEGEVLSAEDLDFTLGPRR